MRVRISEALVAPTGSKGLVGVDKRRDLASSCTSATGDEWLCFISLSVRGRRPARDEKTVNGCWADGSFRSGRARQKWPGPVCGTGRRASAPPENRFHTGWG